MKLLKAESMFCIKFYGAPVAYFPLFYAKLKDFPVAFLFNCDLGALCTFWGTPFFDEALVTAAFLEVDKFLETFFSFFCY